MAWITARTAQISCAEATWLTEAPISTKQDAYCHIRFTEMDDGSGADEPVAEEGVGKICREELVIIITFGVRRCFQELTTLASIPCDLSIQTLCLFNTLQGHVEVLTSPSPSHGRVL